VAKPYVACFDCPNCAAKYKLVRAEADAKTLDRQITCRSCGVPFHGREGSMGLKYSLVDRPKVRASAARLG
jgi:transcription elongation factor Elf1